MPGRCRKVLPETATVDEWLHGRTTGIGGSEVAALLGASPYATSFDVFRNKVDQTGAPHHLGAAPISGPKVRAELLTDNPVLEWGHRLEQAVAVKTADELGMVARSGGGLYQHLDHPVAIVTPDRVATKRRSWEPQALIECKTAGDPWEADQAPVQYQVQAQWQMGITGVTPCWLGCLVLNHDRDYHLVRVDFDQQWFDEMVEIAERFWTDHVLTGEPPMHDLAHPRTTELLKELHPAVKAPAIVLPEGAAEWIDAYVKARDVAHTAERHLEECKNWLRVQLGDAGAGYIGEERVVSYPEVRTTRISARLVRSLYPEVAEECSETSTYRRLSVRRPKTL